MTLARVLIAAVACVMAVGLIVKMSESWQERKRKSSSENEIEDLMEGNDGQREDPLPLHYVRHLLYNIGQSSTKVSSYIWVPDGVEITAYFQQGSRISRNEKRSVRDDGPGQWIGETINAKRNTSLLFQLSYTNHPEEIVSPNTKTFHKLYTAVKVLQPGKIRGYIYTPDFPSSYPNGAEIKWFLSFPPGNIVILNMIDYSIEECCDRLIVYDGEDANSPVLGMVSGVSGSTNSSHGGYKLTSTGPNLYLVFTSDCLVSGRGFQASYENDESWSMITTAQTPTTCGEVLTLTYNSGIVLSPNYPANYYNNMNCSWFVQTASNTQLRLRVNYFYLQYGDNLAIYDGTPEHPGNLLEYVSGYLYPWYTLLASYNRAYLVFTSNSNLTAPGFNISYEGEYNEETTPTTSLEGCSGTDYEYYSGNITSPGFYTQDSYASDLDCQWIVTTYSNTFVQFRVEYFNVEYGYDYVDIFNDNNNSSLLVRLTGYISPSIVGTSPSNRAYVYFHSDYIVNYRGFVIQFYGVYSFPQTTEPSMTNQTAVPSVCAETDYLYGYYGYIESPSYPNYYGANLNCRWSVTTPFGTRVYFTVMTFSLASGDYLRIYNGNYASNSSLIAVWSGYLHNGYSAYGDSYEALLEFSSDWNYESQGFYIRYDSLYTDYTTTPSYTATMNPYECGGNFSNNDGTILSPNYPNSYYNYLDCTWTVVVDSWMYVLFTVNRFDTESCCDFVYVYEGTPGNATYLTQWRGYESPGTQALAHDYRAFLTFRTDYSVTDSGFSIQYSAVSRYYTEPENSQHTTLPVLPWDTTTTWWKSERELEGKIIGFDLWKGAKNRPRKKP